MQEKMLKCQKIGTDQIILVKESSTKKGWFRDQGLMILPDEVQELYEPEEEAQISELTENKPDYSMMTDDELKELYKEKTGTVPRGKFIRENIIEKL